MKPYKTLESLGYLPAQDEFGSLERREGSVIFQVLFVASPVNPRFIFSAFKSDCSVGRCCNLYPIHFTTRNVRARLWKIEKFLAGALAIPTAELPAYNTANRLTFKTRPR
jgi:hypothetical protein